MAMGRRFTGPSGRVWRARGPAGEEADCYGFRVCSGRTISGNPLPRRRLRPRRRPRPRLPAVAAAGRLGSRQNVHMANDSEAAASSDDPRLHQQETLGSFIRMQRQLARLSLREMAAMTAVSNAYLSQVERNLHQPSLKVMQSIADALGLPTETCCAKRGLRRRITRTPQRRRRTNPATSTPSGRSGPIPG